MGGITYGRMTEGFELLRPDWEQAVEGSEDAKKFVKPKAEGQ